MNTRNFIQEKKIICIVHGLKPVYLQLLAEALLRGGISLLEVTFNQAHPETWADTYAGIRAKASYLEQG